MQLMVFQSRAYRVLIASPSDLIEERQIATDAINEWNAQHAAAEGIVLLPEKFETHAMPQAGVRPQQAINDQLVSRCDILIGMFWTKYGSDTGVAESGTVEEIDQAVAAGKPVMLYFSACPIDPGKIDLGQHQKLRKFKEETYKNALVGNFSSHSDLKQILLRDLVRLVRTLKSRDKLRADVEAKAEGRRRESLEIGKQLLQPYLGVFRSPKLCVSLGPASPHREVATREELLAFVKRTASQNHLGDSDQQFDIEFQKQALFKSPTILRHQANISCFQDAERFDPWDARDPRLSTAKFITFDQFGFATSEISLYPRDYATRFGPGGGAADPVKSYCFWHIVLYLRHLLAWTSKFYRQFSIQTELFVKVSLGELRGYPLKLEYGVSEPYEAAELSVTTKDLPFRSEQLEQSQSLVITSCYELLWDFGNDVPPSEERVAQLVRLLWDGRDC